MRRTQWKCMLVLHQLRPWPREFQQQQLQRWRRKLSAIEAMIAAPGITAETARNGVRGENGHSARGLKFAAVRSSLKFAILIC